jgi:hypothetical protein
MGCCFTAIVREPCIPTLAGVAIRVIDRAAEKRIAEVQVRVRIKKSGENDETTASTLQILQRILLGLALLVTRKEVGAISWELLVECTEWVSSRAD